jgi:hypothetical protein
MLKTSNVLESAAERETDREIVISRVCGAR